MIILALVLSILAGAAIVVSRLINSSLAQHLGFLTGTGINCIVGLIVSLAYLLIRGTASSLTAAVFMSVPPWAYLGGVLGVVVVMLSSFLTPRMPVFYLTLLMFLGQMFASILIDWFALGYSSPGRMIGGLLVVTGLVQNMLVDQKTAV